MAAERPNRWKGFVLGVLGGVAGVLAMSAYWQGRTDRLHDRLRYGRESGGAWQVQRLVP